MVGSTCFALGAIPGYVSLVGIAADGITFFVGSIFFTSAAYLQYLEVANTSPSPGHRARPFRPASWEPRRIDWLATAIQLVGTVFFNISTFRAMIESLDAEPASLLSWRPDALGSVCFLVASWLAFAEAGHGWVSWRPTTWAGRSRRSTWRGRSSSASRQSARTSFPSTGDLLSAALANGGTFLGALGFLAGAALLLPEAAWPRPREAAHS